MDFGSFVLAVQPLIPITVLAAFALFLLKEGLEWLKRRRADARKLAAIKRVISRDLEINAWVLRCARDALNAMELLDMGSTYRMEIKKSPGGRLRYEHWDSSEGEEAIRSGGMFPAAATSNIDKYILDAATLDKQLLALMEDAASALAELEHVRSSTMEQIENPIAREGFVDYGREELGDVRVVLEKLYKYCTGKTKLEHRIR